MWFGVSLMYGQEQAGASGITAREYTSHTLKISSVVMLTQKLHHHWCSIEYDLFGEKQPQAQTPSSFPNVNFILRLMLSKSQLFLFPD